MDEIIDYIKAFLVYGNEDAAKHIGYTADEAEWSHYRLVILPGKNILTGERREWTTPDLCAPTKAEKTGEYTDEMGETTGGTWVIREDIIYNTLFCISLAGELCMPCEKDKHGRVPASQSPLGKQGLCRIPVIDEYARLCTKLVEATLPDQHFANIVLSHDIDMLDRYRHLRGFLGAIARGHARSALRALQGLDYDPVYTFPWMHDMDSRVSNATELYLIKATPGKGYDYPQFNLFGGDWRELQEQLDGVGAEIGLHSSYYATDNPTYAADKQRLEEAIGKPVRTHRSHFLRLQSVKAIQALADSGITDDYTMGWADSIGFRLATTRPVRWINPETLTLSSLTLHPLAIMDCTLSNAEYMNIQDEQEAYYTCQQVIDKVRQHGGELCLLWHNSIFAEPGYHKQLYRDIIDYLSE